MVDFLGLDFPFEVNHKIVVKLNTGCVQNVDTAWRGRLGRPHLGTDTEDFFPGTSHTYPHWMRSMFPSSDFSRIVTRRPGGRKTLLSYEKV